MRMALARTARLAWDWRGPQADFPKPPAPEEASWTVPSSVQKRSVEDVARLGGGLSAPELADDPVSGELAPGRAGTRYPIDVVPPSA